MPHLVNVLLISVITGTNAVPHRAQCSHFNNIPRFTSTNQHIAFAQTHTVNWFGKNRDSVHGKSVNFGPFSKARLFSHGQSLRSASADVYSGQTY